MTLFLLHDPTDLPAFLTHARGQAPNAAPVPATGEVLVPPGYDLDRHRVTLGVGAATWDRARAAIQAWAMFDLPWIRIHPAQPEVAVDTQVAVVARQFPLGPLGLWVRNAARVAWVADDAEGPVRRYGFCYVTLPCHVEQGAERFQVTWDQQTDEVAYEILAISRPGHPLARLTRPWVRRQQRRFARGSLEGMRRAVVDT